MKPYREKKEFHGVNGLFLTVYVVFRIGRISFCLHHFHRGDEDPDCHDHPFSFLSIVLNAGYREHCYDGSQILRRPGSIAYRPATHRHRVELMGRKCWTICIKRDADRVWGFWSDGVFVPWKDYIKSKGLEPYDDKVDLINEANALH